MDTPTDTLQTVRSFVLGLEGGVIATLVMTAFRMPISHSLPPTANFWAKYVGDGEPDDYPLISFLLHVGYGIMGGGVYGLVFDDPEGESRATIELFDLLRGLVYGLAASIFGSRVVLRHVIGMDLEADEALIFHVGHVMYGLTLGAWIGSNR